MFVRDASNDRWVVHAPSGEFSLRVPVTPDRGAAPVTHMVPFEELRTFHLRIEELEALLDDEKAAHKETQFACSEHATMAMRLVTERDALKLHLATDEASATAFKEGFRVAVFELSNNSVPNAAECQAKQRDIYPESQDLRIDWDRGYDEAIACYRMGYDFAFGEVPVTIAAALDQFGDKRLLKPDPRGEAEAAREGVKADAH